MPRAVASTRRAAISGDIILAKVSGETVVSDVSGQWVIAKISGEVVKVSGELVPVVTRSGDYVVVSGTVITNISGQWVIAKVSGETVSLASGTGPILARSSGEIYISKISGEVVKVSGETVVSKVSGEIIDIKVPTSVTSGGIFVVGAQSGGVILTSAPCVSVTIKAMSANSGNIFTAGHTMQSGQGFVLEAGEAVNLDVDNYGKVRLLAVISGDRVTFLGVG